MLYKTNSADYKHMPKYKYRLIKKVFMKIGRVPVSIFKNNSVIGLKYLEDLI